MNKRILIFMAFFVITVACDDRWLDEKRDINLVVPTTLEDMEALLNNDLFYADHIGLAEPSADNYYITEENFLSLSETDRALYTWQPHVFNGRTRVSEWNDSYYQVFMANVILEELSGIEITQLELAQYNQVKGGALFFRAKALYNLAQQFAPVYNPATAEAEKCIPLRLTADVTVPSVLSTVEQTYRQIVSDLKAAARLLPETPDYPSEPSKPAAYAMLSRCNLTMADYDLAYIYADSCLQMTNALLDYNSLDTSATQPFDQANPEIIVYSTSPLMSILEAGVVDSILYRSYSRRDLRLKCYFQDNGNHTVGFKGHYTGTVRPFGGLTTAEMFLNRAECSVRKGDNAAAIIDISSLLAKRYQDGEVPILPSSGKELLDFILLERRKELLFRGLRWSDLRRLNLEPDKAVVLSRHVGQEVYTLAPNSEGYVLPIPDYIIDATGLDQIR